IRSGRHDSLQAGHARDPGRRDRQGLLSGLPARPECGGGAGLALGRRRLGGDRLALAPGLPAPLETLDELLRLVGVDPLPERDRGELELAAALIDLLAQMAVVRRILKRLGATLDLVP